MQVSNTLAQQLREWAMGHKPEKAAVDFLIATNSIGPFVRTEGRSDGGPWVDWDAIEDALGRVAYSSGEAATLRLALSIRRGEIDDLFWAMDPSRQAAFVAALAEHS